MRTIYQVLFLFIFVFSLILSCENIPDNSVWPPDESNDGPTPVITSITPDPATADENSVSFAGVGVVYIEGQNFSAVPEENRVFFNAEQGEVLEASNTTLKVRVANVVDDSIKVYLNVKNALEYASYAGDHFYSPLKLKSALSSYRVIDEFNNSSGLAIDGDDNIYFLGKAGKLGTVFKVVHPDSDAVEYGTTSEAFIVTGCLRFGPDGSLFLNRKTRTMYKIPAGGGALERYTTMTGNVAYYDFDANGNMFAGGNDGTIESVLADGVTKKTSATYTDYVVTSMRVYGGYVYLSAQYNGEDSLAIQEGIWKNQILDTEANLGANELVFDWSTHTGEGGPAITEFTFDEDGEMYIGQSTGNAIYLLNAGEYFYPQIIDSPVTKLTWGNSKYLYMNQHPDDPANWDIVRIELTKNGAPYLGRP